MNPPPLIPAWKQFLLVWGLRLKLARGSLGSGVRALPALGGMVLLGLSALLVLRGSWGLFRSAALEQDNALGLFLLLLVGFLTSTLWALWPVVTASVDDASELMRFAAFPLKPSRLFLASLSASLIEPRAWILWASLVGTSAAMVSHGASWLVAVSSTLLLALGSGAWGRVGLHALLNLLRSRRSAEAMGGGLLLLLFASAFVPPPDLSWLRSLAGATPEIDSRLLAGGTVVFSLIPSGGWAWALFGSAAGSPATALLGIVVLAFFTSIGIVIAWVMLERFHRRAGRALPQASQEREQEPRASFTAASTFRVLIEREAREVLVNPRVRVMAALPFFLTILLKLVGARGLAEVALGPLADAWLLTGVAAYGALVLGGGLSQNAFGYDGHGATLLLAAPVPRHLLLRAKNIVHGTAALLLSLSLVLFYSLWIGRPETWVLVLVTAASFWQASWLVAVGNLLSVLLPVRFNASLKRRDRPPPASVALGLLAAAIAVAPASMMLRSGASPMLGAGVVLLFVPLGFYLRNVSEKIATRLLTERSAAVLRALTRS